MATATSAPLLELKGISKRFGAVQALTDVDFECSSGEVVGLIGDNGAGKSTLIKVVSGTYIADSGVYRFDGRDVHPKSPKDVSLMGIATVYQDLSLCDNLDVVDNLYLGSEVHHGRGPLAFIDEVPMEKRAIEILRELSVKLPSVRTAVASLSGGQRQSVAVARAVLQDARIVILDEPTAALGVPQTRQVLDLIKRLKHEGLGVIVISHNLADVFDVCDRVVVLRLGRRVAEFDLATTDRNAVVAAITGADDRVAIEADIPATATELPS